jgi:beta-lactamase regulating signal transducer with metallopeptidase domain
MVVETIFWFHPLVWWIRARLIDEGERACDEEVLRLGNEAEVYAAGILEAWKLYLELPLASVSGATGRSQENASKRSCWTGMRCG